MKELPVLNSSSASVLDPASRSNFKPVVLIGFQNMGNLGLGYLASVLRKAGYRVEVLDFQADREEILRVIRFADPILVGFSLIFQFYILQFAEMMDFLRDEGVDCHFTMGGHFPSLSHEQTLELAPELDSVVRFEGEITLLEMADFLNQGKDWRDIQGIAYRKDSQVVSNPLRSLIEDLDVLPYPDRDFNPPSVLGLDIMPIIASRGCSRTCSFCSIHTFYRAVPGKIVRLRKTRTVVEEMKHLYEERNTKVFLFQDDDFPIVGPVWRRWTLDLVEQLYKADLVGKVIWKINCRADVVETELFEIMRDAGLYMVYMGLESGSEEGLSVLNKRLGVAQNIKAVETLKKIGLMFQYGFMLFDPSSTFNSIRENITFLRRITGDGSIAATFCRMLPYDGTAIKTELEQSGRFKGDVVNPDYDFLDPRIDGLFREVTGMVNMVGWIHGIRSLSPELTCVWHEVAVMERLFPGLIGLDFFKEKLSTITNRANSLLFDLVEDISYAHEHGRKADYDIKDLEFQCKELLNRLLVSRDEFVLQNQDTMLQLLGISDYEPEPVHAY